MQYKEKSIWNEEKYGFINFLSLDWIQQLQLQKTCIHFMSHFQRILLYFKPKTTLIRASLANIDFCAFILFFNFVETRYSNIKST